MSTSTSTLSPASRSAFAEESSGFSDEEEEEYQCILTSQQNAARTWGADSAQHVACAEIAASYLGELVAARTTKKKKKKKKTIPHRDADDGERGIVRGMEGLRV